MSSRHDQEWFFSENVDRILAGERPTFDPRMDEDLRTALEFAAEMADMEPSVRPEFQTELQAKLRSQLMELEEKARTKGRGGWLQRLIRQPAWQAVAGMIVLVAAGIILWASGVFQPAAVTQPDILGVTASTNKTEYAVGEDVNIEVRLKNVTASSFTIEKFPPILSVMDDETGQPVYTTTAGQNTMVLTAGQETSFSITWDQIDAGGEFAGPGRYYLELEDIDNQGQPVELNLSSPVYFRID